MLLSTFAIANAKTWSIYVSSPAKAGTMQLPAGRYHVKLKGNQAMFTKADTDKTYTEPVKIDNAAKKYSETAVLSKKQGTTEKIESIELGGSTSRIDFSE